MKKLFTIFFLLVLVHVAQAQAPQRIPYQAVARDNFQNPLPSRTIGLRFTIHDVTSTGTAVYQETFTTTTSTTGSFGLNIGAGTPTLGTFANVAWGNGAKYLQGEMDAAGGVAYSNIGTQQIKSVPYALYANNTPPAGANGDVLYHNGAGWVTLPIGTGGQTLTMSSGGTPVPLWAAPSAAVQMGQYYQGGMVYYILSPGDPGYDPSVTHGLIAAMNDVGTGTSWDDGTHVLTGASRTLIGTSLENYNDIFSMQGAGSYAAYVARTYTDGTYTDWRLPSKDELLKLSTNYWIRRGWIGGTYWSSSEIDANNAWGVTTYYIATPSALNKSTTGNVCPIRSF